MKDLNEIDNGGERRGSADLVTHLIEIWSRKGWVISGKVELKGIVRNRKGGNCRGWRDRNWDL